MPLIRIDAFEGRSQEEVKTLLDAAHRAVLSAFKVRPRDRYQIYHEHPASHLIVEDTGLGIERTQVEEVISSSPATAVVRGMLCRDIIDATPYEIHPTPLPPVP